MSCNNRAHVLAVGIDAAEPALIRQLIEQGHMPVLGSLLAEGKWLRVESPAHIGSGSVWPTFITGEDPTRHGVYGEWPWQPETMGLSRYSGRHLRPFWKPLIDQGIRIGVLDVPFAPFVGFTEGFEISEWGPHDWLEGHLQIDPESVGETVTQQISPHPLRSDRLDAAGPRDDHGLKKLSSGCLQGIRLRGALSQSLLAQTDPQLAVIVFTEIHHAGHYMWHTVAPDHPIYNQDFFGDLALIEPTLKDLYCEVDSQIGRLLEAVGPKATVLVFSLHGMKPTHGVPAFVEPVLCELGYAKRAGWHSQSWTERGIELMAAAKRRAPKALKKVYYRSLPPTTTIRLARPTMMPTYDWQHTQAFSLPSDQHGWVQINLIGREARGIVPPEQYQDICLELEQRLRTLTTFDGRPLVRELFRTARNVENALVQRLPDLVMHWEDAAFSTACKINGYAWQTEPVGKKFTGRHAMDGFCILKGPEGLFEGEMLSAAEMHRVIIKSLNSGE